MAAEEPEPEPEPDWTRHPNYLIKEVTSVHTICRILTIAAVDTVQQTVHIKMSLNVYWTDPRLAERERWQPGSRLPDRLWGPWPELANAVQDGLSVQLLAKGLHDRETGQMNQIIVWEGSINNPMNLFDFPFDLDYIDLIFVNERACLGMDTFVGQMNTYKLVPMNPSSKYLLKLPIPSQDFSDWGPGKAKEENRNFCEAGVPPPFMTVYQWDGQIPEWSLIGFRTRGATFPVPKGGTKEAFVIAFLIERKSEYYFWKAVLPLSLVMFFSCGINIFPVEDLPNRMTMATTMFLAAFATLYTVQQELPKTHFLTSIDKVVTATLMFLAMMAANSWVCYALTEKGDMRTAEALNQFVLFAFPCMYILIVMTSFLPAIERKRKALMELHSAQAEKYADAWPNPVSVSQAVEPTDVGDGVLQSINVTSFTDPSVLWTGSLTSRTGFEGHKGKVFTTLISLAGIPNVADHEFYGMAGRAGAFLWLAAKFIVLMILILLCMLHVEPTIRNDAWFAPIMGVVACALPSSGMPVAGGIVFVPTLTRFAGMQPRDAVAFTAATQMIGVGVLAPINWLFHDRRVFVRDGSGDILWILVLPSWLGIGLTRLMHFSNKVILIAFTVFVGFVAMYTFYVVLVIRPGASKPDKGSDAPPSTERQIAGGPDDDSAAGELFEKDVAHRELKFSPCVVISLILIGILGGILCGAIGIGIEKLVFVFLTMVYKVDLKHAGVTSIISVGFASAFNFLLFAIEGQVPYGFWLMGLPGILVGSTIGPFINQLLGPERLLIIFGTLCVLEFLHNALSFAGIITNHTEDAAIV